MACLLTCLPDPTQFNYIPAGATVYPNRLDVKKAMHAPEIHWYLDQNFFPVIIADGGNGGPEMAGDTSPDPIQKVLPQVIEATNRVLISNGDLDMIIITNGTLLSIQNMTWNGQLGFQSKPSKVMVVDIPDLEYRKVRVMMGIDPRDCHVVSRSIPRPPRCLRHLLTLCPSLLVV